VKLSKRLGLIADLVPKRSRVCDIGTDHGYLPIYLMQTGICKSAIATDVSEHCLAKARKLAKVSDVEVECVLADGLNGISTSTFDVLITAGMGGETIADILGKVEPLYDKTLLLQPMTHYERLLEFLRVQGYSDVTIFTVVDRLRMYYVLQVLPKEV